jgi:hypothetical protein
MSELIALAVGLSMRQKGEQAMGELCEGSDKDFDLSNICPPQR